MAYYNDTVLNSLTTAQKVDELEAILYTSTQIYNVFVSNPQSISISNSIDFNTVSVPGLRGNKHVFNNRKSKEINLSGIIFDTFALEKGLQTIIEEIEALMNPTETGSYDYIGFRLGTTDFYPCYLADFNYDSNLFLSGNPARLEAEIKLVETSNLSEIEITENLETLQPELAEYEKNEANELAQNEIRENNSLLGSSKEYGRLINGDIDLFVDDTGVIGSIDRILGTEKTLGQYNPLENVISWL